MRLVAYTFLVSTAIGFLCEPAGAQQATVRGEVVDKASGSVIAGASVEIVGRNAIALTDEKGQFRLAKVAVGPVLLRVRQLGYGDALITQEISADLPTLRIEMAPNPVVLEGLEIMASRFETRTKSTPFSVRAFRGEELANSASFDVYDFLASRLGFYRCGSQTGGALTNAPTGIAVSGQSDTCIFSRGSWVAPAIYVDDVRWMSDVESLRGWSKADIHRIDVIKRGVEIWIFTHGFAERLAKGQANLRPYSIIH